MTGQRAEQAAQLLAEALRLQKLVDAARAGFGNREAAPTLALLDLAAHSCALVVSGLERMAVRQ